LGLRGLGPGRLRADFQLARARRRERQRASAGPSLLTSRRATIQHLSAQLGAIPSTRRMVQHLASTGVTTTQRTVAGDYLALGLVAANSAGGRPRPLPFA